MNPPLRLGWEILMRKMDGVVLRSFQELAAAGHVAAQSLTDYECERTLVSVFEDRSASDRAIRQAIILLPLFASRVARRFGRLFTTGPSSTIPTRITWTRPATARRPQGRAVLPGQPASRASDQGPLRAGRHRLRQRERLGELPDQSGGRRRTEELNQP